MFMKIFPGDATGFAVAVGASVGLEDFGFLDLSWGRGVGGGRGLFLEPFPFLPGLRDLLVCFLR